MKLLLSAVASACAVAGLVAVGASGAAPVPAEPLMAVQDTAAGRKIFEGKGTCFACHGQNAKGTALAPDLTDDQWLNVDGSLAQVTALIKEGVANPKQFPAPMPAMGGAQLTDAEVQAVAQYVIALSSGR